MILTRKGFLLNVSMVLLLCTVGSTIKRLEKQFSSLQRRLSSELNANSELSPELLLESLTLLPIALRSEYQKSVLENLSTLKKADTIHEIFFYLNPYFSFIDYHLVEYLVEEFGSEQLQEDMSAYVQLVQAFYDETTVQQLMDHWPGRRDIPPHFEELTAVIDEDPGAYTLRRLDNLRKEFCSEIRLFETILILKRFGRKNSFVVCWVVPSIFVPQLKSVISSLRSFYQREHIFSVTVGRQQLYSIAVRDSILTSDPIINYFGYCLILELQFFTSTGWVWGEAVVAVFSWKWWCQWVPVSPEPAGAGHKHLWQSKKAIIQSCHALTWILPLLSAGWHDTSLVCLHSRKEWCHPAAPRTRSWIGLTNRCEWRFCVNLYMCSTYTVFHVLICIHVL